MKPHPPPPKIEIVVKRYLPEATSCCCEPWRAIDVDYQIRDGMFLGDWFARRQITSNAHATHGQALYRYLQSLSCTLRGEKFSVRRSKFIALRVYVYRGKGSKTDHARFLKLEREMKRLVKLSTKELERRTRPTPGELP